MTDLRPWPDRETCLRALTDGDGEGATVAILDTGVEVAHPAFAALDFAGSWRIAMGEDGPRPEPTEPDDPVGHGTSIAGIIHRLAPAARIMSVRVLDLDLRQHRHDAIRAGVDCALAHGAGILNCSFGAAARVHTLPIYKEWTDRAHREGALVVAAAPDRDRVSPEWPAFCSHAIGVAETESSRLGWRKDRALPFVAPGWEIRVPVAGGAKEQSAEAASPRPMSAACWRDSSAPSPDFPRPLPASRWRSSHALDENRRPDPTDSPHILLSLLHHHADT